MNSKSLYVFLLFSVVMVVVTGARVRVAVQRQRAFGRNGVEDRLVPDSSLGLTTAAKAAFASGYVTARELVERPPAKGYVTGLDSQWFITDRSTKFDPWRVVDIERPLIRAIATTPLRMQKAFMQYLQNVREEYLTANPNNKWPFFKWNPSTEADQGNCPFQLRESTTATSAAELSVKGVNGKPRSTTNSPERFINKALSTQFQNQRCLVQTTAKDTGKTTVHKYPNFAEQELVWFAVGAICGYMNANPLLWKIANNYHFWVDMDHGVNVAPGKPQRRTAPKWHYDTTAYPGENAPFYFVMTNTFPTEFYRGNLRAVLDAKNIGTIGTDLLNNVKINVPHCLPGEAETDFVMYCKTRQGTRKGDKCEFTRPMRRRICARLGGIDNAANKVCTMTEAQFLSAQQGATMPDFQDWCDARNGGFDGKSCSLVAGSLSKEECENAIMDSEWSVGPDGSMVETPVVQSTIGKQNKRRRCVFTREKFEEKRGSFFHSSLCEIGPDGRDNFEAYLTIPLDAVVHTDTTGKQDTEKVTVKAVHTERQSIMFQRQYEAKHVREFQRLFAADAKPAGDAFQVIPMGPYRLHKSGENPPTGSEQNSRFFMRFVMKHTTQWNMLEDHTD